MSSKLTKLSERQDISWTIDPLEILRGISCGQEKWFHGSRLIRNGQDVLLWQSPIYILERAILIPLYLRVWMDHIKNWDITKPTSSWLVNYLHSVMNIGLASMDGYGIRVSYGAPPRRGRRQALTGLLITVMNLLDRGLVVEWDPQGASREFERRQTVI